jgi:hypothetical protein
MFNRSSMAAVIAELDCIISFITASRTPNLAHWLNRHRSNQLGA